MSHKAKRVLGDLAYVLLTVVAVKLAEPTCRTLGDFFRITWIVRVPRVFELLRSKLLFGARTHCPPRRSFLESFVNE
jgi:long-subunit acyl-CoA synthetase (AMP-forming)